MTSRFTYQPHRLWRILMSVSMLSLAASQADAAPATPTCSDWQASKVYVNGNYVVANKTNWRAKWWTQNNEPGKKRCMGSAPHRRVHL